MNTIYPRFHPAGSRKFGVRWCRREIRLWEANDPRKRRENYELACKLLVLTALLDDKAS